MTARDAMEFMNEQDEATLQRFVERLEFRGKDPTFVGYREAYVDKMALDRTADVLELGCGTGVVTRALAGRVGFEGRVIGIEQSPVLVDVARRLADEEGVGDRIEFRVGDIHALDVPDASVDAVVAHTTMSHVTDPQTVLARRRASFASAARSPRSTATTRRGPTATAITTFATKMEDAIRTAMVSKPRVMRDMPRLFRDAGLRLVGVESNVYADVGQSAFFLNAAEAFAPLVARSELMPVDVVDAWLADLRQASADGMFFAACNYYAYIATR